MSAIQLKSYKLPQMGFLDMPEPEPSTPSEWFSRKFPMQAEVYGAPILEERYSHFKEEVSFTRIKPLALNEDFFAAMLGGNRKLGHHVVFYPKERVFYFFDHWQNCFVPTFESKLETLLSQYLIHCAQDMKHDVDIEYLFYALREERKLKNILLKAKSLLAVHDSFFTGTQGNRRRVGERILDPSAEPAHKLFIREGIVPEPSHDLTVHDAYINFTRYCQIHDLTPVNRRDFKNLIAEVVREEFGLGIRNDLKLQDGKWGSGWRGITCRLPELPAQN